METLYLLYCALWPLDVTSSQSLPCAFKANYTIGKIKAGTSELQFVLSIKKASNEVAGLQICIASELCLFLPNILYIVKDQKLVKSLDWHLNILTYQKCAFFVKQTVNVQLPFSCWITVSAAAAATVSWFCISSRWLSSKCRAREQTLVPLSLLFDDKKSFIFLQRALSERSVWVCCSSLDHRADFQSGASQVFYFTPLITVLGDLKFQCCHFYFIYFIILFSCWSLAVEHRVINYYPQKNSIDLQKTVQLGVSFQPAAEIQF